MLEPNKTFFHDINNQVTSYLFERARPEIIIGLISALVVAGVFWKSIDPRSLLIWITCAVVLYLLRFMIIRGGKSGEVRGTRSFLFLLMLALCGLLWGIAGYSIGMLESNIYKVGLLACIVCLCFFITMIYSGKLSYFLAFTLPALGLTTYALLDQAAPWNPMALYLLIATGVFLLFLSLLYRNSFLSGIRLKAEHDQLLKEHDSLLEESQKMEVALKSTSQKNNEILENLNKASENLNQCEDRKESLISTLKTNIRFDPVTNLSNRKDFIETVEQEWQRASRSKDPLSVAFINVDDFEKLNKNNDRNMILSTLKKIASSIKAHGRRAGDLPARFDKSGFALLLLGADSKNASKIVENIRMAISDLNLSVNHTDDPVTVHAGVATLIPNRKSDPEELLENVESAAYEAQFQGGDRVISFQPFQDIAITPWDSIKDGELNEANFQQKLFSRGHNTKREVISPKTTFKDQSFSKPTLFAVFSGNFLLNIEGQAHEIKRGSSLVLPEGVSFSAEVIGDDPVILYLEKR